MQLSTSGQHWLRTIGLLALWLGSLSSAQAASDTTPLKVGTTAGFAPPLEVTVTEAAKQGLKVELIEFSDWIAPNVSWLTAIST